MQTFHTHCMLAALKLSLEQCINSFSRVFFLFLVKKSWTVQWTMKTKINGDGSIQVFHDKRSWLNYLDSHLFQPWFVFLYWWAYTCPHFTRTICIPKKNNEKQKCEKVSFCICKFKWIWCAEHNAFELFEKKLKVIFLCFTGNSKNTTMLYALFSVPVCIRNCAFAFLLYRKLILNRSEFYFFFHSWSTWLI